MEWGGGGCIVVKISTSLVCCCVTAAEADSVMEAARCTESQTRKLSMHDLDKSVGTAI